MPNFGIITSKEIALKAIEYKKSVVLNRGRTCRVAEVSHSEGFSLITFESVERDTIINPQDVFWMGFYIGGMELPVAKEKEKRVTVPHDGC